MNQITGWAPVTYGDVSVEVTVRLLRIGSAGGYSGLGLLLRATGSDQTAPTHFVEFTVDELGHWFLARSDGDSGSANQAYHVIAGDFSTAIHTQDGAANQLLALLRGNRASCYVNGHFMGAYDLGPGPANGHAGVILDDASAQAAYAEFTVYQAPPPGPLGLG